MSQSGRLAWVRLRDLVSGAARKALWTCLIDEPTLLVRFFFEKLSQRERRVRDQRNPLRIN